MTFVRRKSYFRYRNTLTPMQGKWAMFLTGLIFILVGVYSFWDGYRKTFYVPIDGFFQNAQYQESFKRSNNRNTPNQRQFKIRIQYSYNVDQESFQGNFTKIFTTRNQALNYKNQLSSQTTFDIVYDPENPSKSALASSRTSSYLFGFIFLVIGFLLFIFGLKKNVL